MEATTTATTETTPTAKPRTPQICPHQQTVCGRDYNGGWKHAFGTRCNRWSCPVCGPQRTKLLCKRLAAGKPNRLITLTCGRPAGREPGEVWEQTRRQVPELIRRIRKEVGAIEYARVMEVHKSGYPHYHLVVRSPYIDQELLSKWWCHLTDAFIVDIRKVNPTWKVAEYLAKYLTKQLTVPFTTSRCSFSRGWDLPTEQDEKPKYDLREAARESCRVRSYLDWYYPDAEIDWLNESHAIIVSAGQIIGDIWDEQDDGSWHDVEE